MGLQLDKRHWNELVYGSDFQDEMEQKMINWIIKHPDYETEGYRRSDQYHYVYLDIEGNGSRPIKCGGAFNVERKRIYTELAVNCKETGRMAKYQKAAIYDTQEADSFWHGGEGGFISKTDWDINDMDLSTTVLKYIAPPTTGTEDPEATFPVNNTLTSSPRILALHDVAQSGKQGPGLLYCTLKLLEDLLEVPADDEAAHVRQLLRKSCHASRAP